MHKKKNKKTSHLNSLPLSGERGYCSPLLLGRSKDSGKRFFIVNYFKFTNSVESIENSDFNLYESTSSICCHKVFKNIDFSSPNGTTTLASILSNNFAASFVQTIIKTSTSQKKDIISSFKSNLS
ncbi:MAG: hypothetical protein Q8S84_09315 [bacterium]|nr:hypothetical protein [bacterium]